MRFPGHRNPKHYFPLSNKANRLTAEQLDNQRAWYLLGLDEVLVDVEIRGSAALAQELGLRAGESTLLSAAASQRMLARLAADRSACSFTAGGTVANTLNNFTHLSGEPAVLLGAIENSIAPGSPAFAYVAQTPRAVDLGHLLAVNGPTGMVFTFIASDGDRAFGVAPGIAGDYPPEAIDPDVVRQATIVLAALYSLRPATRPIASALVRLLELAREADVPVAFGLGTATLVRETRDQVRELLANYVTVASMNLAEAAALTGESDALLAGRAILEWVDAVIITEGPRGLTISGYTDERVKRQTREPIRSGAIAEYNRWEFSRLVRRKDCQRPLMIHSHIHPYQGGPERLANTSGAGDAVLAAFLHDIVANQYHLANVPDSPKHASEVPFLTYSSLSRNAQYGNRVAYEVLAAQSPRLDASVGPDPRSPEEDA